MFTIVIRPIKVYIFWKVIIEDYNDMSFGHLSLNVVSRWPNVVKIFFSIGKKINIKLK